MSSSLNNELPFIGFSIAALFITHIGLKRYLKMPERIKQLTDDSERSVQFNDYCSYFVSFLHSFIMFAFSVYRIGFEQVKWDSSNSFLEVKVMVFSISYLISDLILAVYYGFGDSTLYIHHITCFSLPNITGTY